MARRTGDLEAVLGDLQRAAKSNGAKVSVGEIVETFGKRSFGPLLLLTGLLGMTPVAAVPSAPSIIALITVLIAGQLLFGRETIWLPGFLEKLSVKAARVAKAARIAKRPVHIADRITRPRMLILTTPLADRLVALACVLVAACVPPLEFLPFVAFVPSLAIFAFGLSLVARDGLLVLIALTISVGTMALIAWKALGG
jgi:hypothetical protein